MKLGFVSDSLAALPFEAMLDQALRLGVQGVEVNTGGWSAAPHVDLAALVADAGARRRFLAAFADRGLEVVALNANGNPLHPADHSQAGCLRDTIRAAGAMGIATVCTMSGLPAGRPGDLTPNWVVTNWPPESAAILRHQWEDRLLPFWEGIAGLARASGVARIAIELHGGQLVHNVPTLLRLRAATGPLVGANLDPSHLFWMGADPLAAAEALAGAIHHVHAKDTLPNPARQATAGLLDPAGPADGAGRAWSYVTLGVGHGEAWWRQFCYRLRRSGYDGWLAVEHEDALLDPLDGLEKSVALLRGVMPAAAAGAPPGR